MSPILTKITGAVATVTLNRPEQMNAIDLDMAKALYKAAHELAEQKSVRAVILTGAGDKAFCAGGDLSRFYQQGEAIAEHLKDVTDYLHGAVSCFAKMNAPVITAVNGVTAGGGLAFIGFPQLVLASRSARFVSAYTKAGLSPDGSSTWYLPRLMGMRRANEFIFTNRMLSAEEAAEWGLVTRVVEQGSLMAEAVKVAEQLANGPQQAYGRIKHLLNTSLTTSLDEQMSSEARYLAQSAAAPDGQEGIGSFLNKQSPHFTE